jgi:predicted kinase
MEDKTKPGTNEERLKALKETFAEQSGKAIVQNIIRGIATMGKICELAQVDSTYVYGHKGGTDDELARYKDFVKDVKTFNKNFIKRKKNITAIAVTSETKYLDSLEQNHDLDKEKVALVVQCGLLQGRIEKLMVEKAHLFAENPSPVPGPEKLIQITDITIHTICPDEHLEIDGRYRYHNRKLRDQAWSKARTEFARLMKRKVKQRVYILVGPPNSGKSSWAAQKNISPDRHAVIVDATNLTAGDRATWIVQAQKAIDVKICVVYFLIDPLTLAARNSQRERKKIDADVLQEKFESLEEVDPHFEEVDEMLYVRESDEY